MSNLFPYLQFDDSFSDLGVEFRGVLSAASFMNQNFHTKNNQGRTVRGSFFNGGLPPFLGFFPKWWGLGQLGTISSVKRKNCLPSFITTQDQLKEPKIYQS